MTNSGGSESRHWSAAQKRIDAPMFHGQPPPTQAILLINKGFVTMQGIQKHFITLSLILSFVVAVMVHAAPATAAATQNPSDAGVSHIVAQLEQTHAEAKILAALKSTSTPEGKALYGAANIFCTWNTFTNNPARQAPLGAEFIRDVKSYLKATGGQVDPLWASIQAQFILANLTSNAVNQIEFWSGTPALRQQLLPAATLARKLLKIALTHYSNVVTKLNNATTFSHADEALYTTAINGQRDAGYYLAYGDYFAGLAMPRGKARQALLAAAIKRISVYAGSQNNGVYYRALLLRGKAFLHSGQYNKAIHDLTIAQSSHAPVWLQYDARYQEITALLRSGKYHQAAAKLKTFMAWTDKQAGANSVSAKMGEQLLAFRIATASAKTLKDPVQRAKAEAAAEQIVSDVISKAPQYQSLIFSHLAQSIPVHAAKTKLTALQVLALAWLDAQNPATESQRQALATAESLLKQNNLPAAIRAEATLITAITASQLGEMELAARMNVAFVRLAPTDPRAKHAIAMALSELAQLNESRQVPTSINTLTTEAISLDWRHFHDPQIRFPYALQLENSGQYAQAIHLFDEIPSTDSLYLDAQYQLVRIGAEELSAMGTKNFRKYSNAAPPGIC